MMNFLPSELSPRESTLQFIRFFARNYVPLDCQEGDAAKNLALS